jgi:hypothetical protein
MREEDFTHETHLGTCVRRYDVKKSRDLNCSNIPLRPLPDLVTPSDDEPCTIFEN